MSRVRKQSCRAGSSGYCCGCILQRQQGSGGSKLPACLYRAGDGPSPTARLEPLHYPRRRGGEWSSTEKCKYVGTGVHLHWAKEPKLRGECKCGRMRDWEKKPNCVLKTPPKQHPLLSGGKHCLLGAVPPSPAVGHEQGQQMSQEIPGMGGQAAVTVTASLCPCGKEELQLLRYRVTCVHMTEEPQNIQCLSCRA